MKLRLEATPDELREKSGKLIERLRDELIDLAPGLAAILEKALSPKEAVLKYPVLRELAQQTSDEYDRTIERMLKDIGKVLDRPLEVAKTDLSKGWACEVCGAVSPGPGCEHVQKALYIGPRGGKWADLQHTIPWDPEKHGRQVAMRFDKPSRKDPRDPRGIRLGMDLSEVEEAIHDQPVEHLVALDHAGVRTHLMGSSTRVWVSPELCGAWLESGNVVVTHNHPQASMLSLDDMLLAVRLGLKEMRAVTPDGTVYRRTRPGSD